MSSWVPLASSLISLIFALAVFDQYMARRKPYQLIWAYGLFLYFIATGSEAIMGFFGSFSTIYRLWYLSGAMLVAAYLGLGTCFLLAPRNWAIISLIFLLLATLYATFKVFSSPVNLELAMANHVLHGRAFPEGAEGPRLITIFLNAFGTIWLVGGALWSAWEFWRRKILPQRVLSNILIALGALLPALGGTFSRLGETQYLYLSELLGIIIIFLGFLHSKEVFGFYRIPLMHGLFPKSK